MGSTQKAFTRRVREDESGFVLILFGVGVLALFAMAGFAVDVAHLMQLRGEVQASTDAAALAAAQFLPDGAAAVSAANSYSGGVGGKNRRSNHPLVTMDAGYPLYKCVDKTGYPACGPGGSNVIVVSQISTVPTFFSRVIGWNSLTVRAHSAALMKGGVPKTLDVAIILDTTKSMDSDIACTGVGTVSRLDCAFAGFRSLLNGFWPCPQNTAGCTTAQAMDTVSLFVFPGLTNAAQQPLEYDCSGSTHPQIESYGSPSPPMLYQVLGLTNDFKTSNTSALNTSSNLVKAARGSGCSGVETIGGKGTYYAGALNAAQTYLAASGRPDAQNVIILLSDGDANADAPSQITSALESNQCQQAVSAAAAAKAAGSWVYSIAYGASTSSSSCSKDSSSITACSAMRQIASDPTKFYSTTQSGGSACTSAANPQTDLLPIFQHISLSLTTTRLVDE